MTVDDGRADEPVLEGPRFQSRMQPATALSPRCLEMMMRERVVTIASRRIDDWHSFHSCFAEAFGFPAFYGRNMNAWIDCLAYIDEGDGMSNIILEADEILVLRIEDASSFEARCPEQFEVLVRCAAIVDERREGRRPIIALDLSR